jgi:hypothetical protein
VEGIEVWYPIYSEWLVYPEMDLGNCVVQYIMQSPNPLEFWIQYYKLGAGSLGLITAGIENFSGWENHKKMLYSGHFCIQKSSGLKVQKCVVQCETY